MTVRFNFVTASVIVFALLGPLRGGFAAETKTSEDSDSYSDTNSTVSGFSPFLEDSVNPPGEEVPLDFCQEWNPEFEANGMRCCGKKPAWVGRKGRRGRMVKARCDAHRNRRTYCDEVTSDEKEYIEAANDGKVGDLLEFLSAQVAHRPTQAYCSVNNGFLVDGRAIVPTKDNILKIRSPERCTSFATEQMVAMIEWLGREVKKEFYEDNPGIHVLIGDVAAPRGGCLAAMGGRRGHKSHTVGEDADIALLTPRGKKPSPDFFHKDLQPKPNWWFVKKIFHNPYACVRVIFFDRKQTNKLARAAVGDPEWPVLRKFLQHVPGHRDHFHVRIGDGPGLPGCPASQPAGDDDAGDDTEE